MSAYWIKINSELIIPNGEVSVLDDKFHVKSYAHVLWSLVLKHIRHS